MPIWNYQYENQYKLVKSGRHGKSGVGVKCLSRELATTSAVRQCPALPEQSNNLKDALAWYDSPLKERDTYYIQEVTDEDHACGCHIGRSC